MKRENASQNGGATSHPTPVIRFESQLFPPSIPQDPTRRSLLIFPYEIRQLIYEFVSASEFTDLIQPLASVPVRKFNCLGLLLTCRPIYLEARRIAYTLSTFNMRRQVNTRYGSSWTLVYNDYKRSLEDSTFGLAKSGFNRYITAVTFAGSAFDAMFVPDDPNQEHTMAQPVSVRVAEVLAWIRPTC